MTANKRVTHVTSVDPDDAPELTDDFFSSRPTNTSAIV